MILQIGNFQFDIDLSYEMLARVAAFKWDEVPLIGTTPSLQYTGREASTLTFTGQWFNYREQGDRVQTLEDIAAAGEPLAVTGDTGHFYGFWVITSVGRDETVFRPGQHSAVKTEFTIGMKFYGGTADMPGVAGGSIDSSSSTVTEVSQTATALSGATTKVIASASDTDLAGLKTLPEYNALVSNSRQDKQVLDSVAALSPPAGGLNNFSPELPTIQSRFKDFLGFVGRRNDYKRNINRVIRKAEQLPGVRNQPTFSTLKTTLRDMDRSLDTAAGQTKAVRKVLFLFGGL